MKSLDVVAAAPPHSDLARPLERLPSTGKVSALETAKRLVIQRRARRRRFKLIRFEDHAWDMLLDLFIASEEGREVSVTSLCLAAQTSTSTALRLVKRLEAKGVLRRAADPMDARRSFVSLDPVFLAEMGAEMEETASTLSG